MVHDFTLTDFSKNIKLFGFIAGYQTRSFGQQDPVNVQAAEKLGKLHDQFKATGYDGHALEILLVRLLFCLFAEDTALFERRLFQDYLEQRTAEDGSDLGMHLAQLFQTLDTPPEKRPATLDEQMAAFPYGKTAFKTEAERVAFLFERYQQLTAPLAMTAKPLRKRNHSCSTLM